MGQSITLLIVGSDLHNGSRQIGEEGGGAVEPSQAGVAAVDMCPAVFSAENGSFVKDGQTLQRCGTAAADDGIRQNPVIERQINAVMIPVKGYRLYGGLLRLENHRHHFHHFHRPHRLLRQKIRSCTSGRLSCTWGS